MSKIFYNSKFFLVFILFNLFLIGGVSAQAKNYSNQKSPGSFVYQKNSESIVLIDAKSSGGRQQGSGVAIRNGSNKKIGNTHVPSLTWVVTNAHVVKDAKYVDVIANGLTYKGEVVFRDEKIDVSFLYVDNAVIKPVNWSEKAKSVFPGDVVFALGAPKGLTTSITEGIVSAVRDVGGVNLIQTTAAISPGSSGGGLFSASGEILGITTFKILGGDSLNFAIDISRVKRMLDAYDAASLLKGQVDSEFLSFFGDDFARWLYYSAGKTNGTVLEEFEYFEEKLFSKKISFEEYFEKERDIISRYINYIDEIKSKSGQRSEKILEESQSKLVLVCKIFSSEGSILGSKSFEVDFSKKSINGFPAKINSREMKYSFKNKNNVEITTTFNRDSGSLLVIFNNSLINGSCSKSEGPLF
ncbi:S1C family serine protease [Macromonas bipunctata]|uniref:S1C family serine protease n=1 Tax=Macromonas bipunctata TaxID=183670 RepID=UPI000C325F6E|nr:S1C family serine protease [Macromonas bipunctata]